EVANIRRMRAKKEAKKRGCSHELLQLMAWSIFITTIDDEDFTIRQAYLLYSLRWSPTGLITKMLSHNIFENMYLVIVKPINLRLRAILIIKSPYARKFRLLSDSLNR
ncbi:MAG: hypothetical protein KJ799_02740, partial [Bacteroidetes bacterium]|nr:hypothetical protein [Bacteroidota bacterium]